MGFVRYGGQMDSALLDWAVQVHVPGMYPSNGVASDPVIRRNTPCLLELLKPG